MRKGMRFPAYVLVTVLVAFSLAPFIWEVSTSLKPQHEVMQLPQTILPRQPNIENYEGIFERRPFGRYILNSVMVASVSTVLALAAGALAAYSVAQTKAKWRVTLMLLFLLPGILPPILFLVPIYIFFSSLRLTNTYAGLILVHGAFHISIVFWVLENFFERFPRDLIHAARVDGYSHIGAFVRIVLPLAAPVAVTAGLLAFIFSWNEFLFALQLISRDELRVATVGISMLSGASIYEIPWGQIAAAVVITSLPVIAAVLIFQRKIVSGLTAGAVKE
ncbi:MAG: carbohydrate ABC transporter permease [Candidatus Abyssobacteria bacterium SURF_5]|uniref:Carbohydrate ABC transporter permease n=1 Tax=Abyssobacteria bacterium (strain SURF_5) TaxID=2093360 RepID=A0A3A4NDH3_ABYX5|nr:MAG: carbohydrate ABC transporter permease [Candidatus Abyssubacteria bacterium SURF_5]